MILHWFTTDVQLSNRHQWEQPQAEQRPWVGNSSNVCPGRKWGCHSFFKLCYYHFHGHKTLWRAATGWRKLQDEYSAICYCRLHVWLRVCETFLNVRATRARFHRGGQRKTEPQPWRESPCTATPVVLHGLMIAGIDPWTVPREYLGWSDDYRVVILFYLMIAWTNERMQRLRQLIQNTTLGTPAHQPL